MPNASNRFSIRRRLKCIHVDEAADLPTAERSFARLCVRMLLAERSRGQGSEEEAQPPKEDEQIVPSP